MQVEDLGRMAYREAWERQELAHAQVVDGAEERLLLVEHPPVITFGRRPGLEKNVLATPEYLKQMGVDVVTSDRGGDVTFHGPGQVVAYPIIRLNDHGLSVGGYVHTLEQIIIDALKPFGVAAQKDVCAVGAWADDGTGTLAKVGAIGVRIRKGVSLHGLAVNVTTDLSYFSLIVPCGLVCRPVTSVRKLLGEKGPDIEAVKNAIVGEIMKRWGTPVSALR